MDETLTFINTKLQVIGEDGQLTSPIEGDLTWMNKYSNENRRYIFFAKDVGRYVTSGRNLYQYTDEGTPQLIITQNNNVRAQVIILDGEYAGVRWNCDGQQKKYGRLCPPVLKRSLPTERWAFGWKKKPLTVENSNSTACMSAERSLQREMIIMCIHPM